MIRDGGKVATDEDDLQYNDRDSMIREGGEVATDQDDLQYNDRAFKRVYGSYKNRRGLQSRAAREVFRQ